MTEKEHLLNLLQDTEVFKPLSKWTNRLNIFDILKISKTEIRHSNMLGWLLDPNENHGLFDSFLYGIIAKISESMTDKAAILKLLSGNLESFSVFRERDNIDILLVSSELETIIAIENKIGSSEHRFGKTSESQLQKYSDTLKAVYEKYTQIKVYLTPEGEEPTISDWIVLTYSDIMEVLESVFKYRLKEDKTEVSILIKNYIETIKKNVIMDDELVKICNDIYNRHKDALDLIFENKDDRCLQINKLFKSVLNDSKELQLFIAKSTKLAVEFKTDALRQFSEDKSVVAFYQLKFLDRGNEIMIECVFHKLKSTSISEDKRRIINQCISGKSAKIRDDNWEWKRAFRYDLKNVGDKTDEEIKKWFQQTINKIVDKEKSIQ